MQSSSRVKGLFGRKLVPGISDWMDCSWSRLIFHNSLDKKLHSCQRVWWLKEGDFKSLCGLVTSRLRGSDSKIIFTWTLKSFNVQPPFFRRQVKTGNPTNKLMIKPNLISYNDQNIKCVREVIGEEIVHTDYCYLPFISFSWGSIYTMPCENTVFDDVKIEIHDK